MANVEASSYSAVVIELDPKGEGGAYRMRNLDGEINRSIIVKRDNTVQADLVSVIHGKHNGIPATLIITDFWFMPGKKSRRFTWARITYKFDSRDKKDGGAGGLGPTVAKIEPEGHFSLHPKQKHVDKNLKLNLGAQAPTVPISPGGSVEWSLGENYDAEDQIKLAGIKTLEGRDFGGYNTARWTLKENEMVNSGIPTRLRTAIVLERKATEAKAKFQGTLEIKVDADLISEMGFIIKRLLGNVPKDDPVIFDPKISTSSVGHQPQNLEKENLKAQCRIETTTKLLGDGTMTVADDKKQSAEGDKKRSTEGDKKQSTNVDRKGGDVVEDTTN
jgi:hypothetical protein